MKADSQPQTGDTVGSHLVQKRGVIGLAPENRGVSASARHMLQICRSARLRGAGLQTAEDYVVSVGIHIRGAPPQARKHLVTTQRWDVVRAALQKSERVIYFQSQ